MGRAARPTRFAAYALWLIAGLLKYYPPALLALLARERRRDALLAATLIFSLLLGLTVGDYAELGKALANIPTPYYYTDSFAAVNLPFGFANALGVSSRSFAIMVLAIPGGLAIAAAQRRVGLLGREPPDWSSFEAEFLIAGAIVVSACFLTARHADYRGAYLVPVAAGLVRFRRSSQGSGVRRFVSWMIAAVLFISWAEIGASLLCAPPSPIYHTTDCVWRSSRFIALAASWCGGG